MPCNRTPTLLVTLLLASGCEDQEAVPASRTLPMAALQVGALFAVVVGGWALLERRRRSRPQAPRRVTHRGPRIVLAYLLGAAGAIVVGFDLWAIAHGAFGYAEPSYQLLSWEETVAIGWWLVVLGGPLALGELRLGAAVARGSNVAAIVGTAQIALIAYPSLASVG